MRKALLLAFALALTACDRNPHITASIKAMEYEALCGNSYTGRVISDDPEDADWRAETLTLGPVACTPSGIVMPLAVGEDRSRVWTLDDGVEGVEFRHAHILPDGSPDPVTGYGGYVQYGGGKHTLRFPADDTTKQIFRDNDLEASLANTWTLTLLPGDTLTYALSRPNRDFRAEFDVSEPLVAEPPAP